MCRHCERLVENIEHKELIHRFMEITAEKVNRKLRATKGPTLTPVTANDIDIRIEVRTGLSLLRDLRFSDEPII